MRAAIRRGPELVIDTLDTPRPGPGQVLARTLACGICGSDLHALHHLDHVLDTAARSGAPALQSAQRDMVFGHEFSAEIVDFGPDCTRRLPLGSQVVSRPYAIGPHGVELIGFSNRFPGGFAEYLVLQEAMLLPVPNGLPPDLAALTEPFAVGTHAVARAGMDAQTAAMVVGCGPVGLSTLAALKRQGFGPVIACDFSPERRAIAERLGADIVVDPAVASPHYHWSAFDVPATLAERAVAGQLGHKGRTAAIFECVGAPGLLQSVIDGSPPGARIVVAGVCMQPDRIEPAIAINKELTLAFAYGYSGREFAQCLADCAEGMLPASLLLDHTIELDQVAQTFDDLRENPRLVKVLVKP